MRNLSKSLFVTVGLIAASATCVHAEQLLDRVAINSAADLNAVALLELPDRKLLNVYSQPTSSSVSLILETITVLINGTTTATTEVYNLPGIVAAAVDSKGRGIVVGTTSAGSNGTDFRIARILPDGSFDSSFGNSGRVAVDLSTQNDYAAAVALDKDDNIVVVGTATLSATDTDFAVVRLSASNGSVLSAVLIPFDLAPSQRLDQASAVNVTNDGRILVGGVAYDGAINKFRIALARLTPTGSIDSTFCNPSCNFQGAYTGINSGRRIYFFGASDAHSDQLYGMGSIGNGDFYVVGTSSPADGSGPKASIAKISSAGNYLTERIGTVGGGALGEPKVYRAVKSADGLGTRLLLSGDAGNGLLYVQAFTSSLAPVSGYGNCLESDSGLCFSSSAVGDVGPDTAGPINLDRTGRPLFTGSFIQSSGDVRGVLRAIITNDSGPRPDLIFRNGFQ